MMTRIAQRRHGLAAIAFGLATTALYVLMITVTLDHIEMLSGEAAFDMRPAGYSPQEAAQLLDALGSEGRTYYLTRQIPLDIVYPALLAMTLVLVIRWFGSRLPNRKLGRFGLTLFGLVYFGVAASVSAAVFDYAENLGISLMILNWQNLSHTLVHATSLASIAKACFTTAATLTALSLGAVWVHRILNNVPEHIAEPGIEQDPDEQGQPHQANAPQARI